MKKILIFFTLFLLVGCADSNILKEEEKVDISKYYDSYVKTNKKSKIYKLVDNEFTLVGELEKGQLVKLKDGQDKYLKIDNLVNEYYIEYSDIDVSEENNFDERYKNYIPFNETLTTKEKVSFYDRNDNYLMNIDESFSFEVVYKDSDRYGIIINSTLMYIHKEDVLNVNKNDNTYNNIRGIAVLNYHFVYDPKEETCDQILCHTVTQFKEHLDYIKNNNYLTVTMQELEDYIDGYIRLPKSVVITIDDGRNVNLATEILEEYKLNGTAFIVTSRYDVDKEFKKSDYVELHSHSHNLHDAGSCPPGHGQGGGLTCFSDDKVLTDLRTSREMLNDSKYFCYPFYEFNAHAVELLKEAGFTMAFAGEYQNGQLYVKPGIDKFRLPRWVMVTYTDMNTFARYLDLKD